VSIFFSRRRRMAPRSKRFEAHAVHEKQVVRVPVSPTNRKLFLGRSHVRGQPKTVPRVAVVLAEGAGCLRLVVNSKAPVVVRRQDGEHVLTQGDECKIRDGDSVVLVQGLPYEYRLVYRDREAAKKQRRGLKPVPEAVITRQPTPGLIAFPSLSTGAFKFDLEKAVPVALDAIAEFLQRHPEPGLRLVLVDAIKSSPALRAFQEQWQARGGDPRFSTVHGNLLRLGSRHDLCPHAVVDPAHAGFDVVAGVNQFLHIAAANLLQDTREVHGSDPQVGQAYPVRVRPGCPLYHEGVRVVIHTVGPNMNPCWPDCLRNDYDKGCRLLHQCYTSVLEAHYAITFQGQPVLPVAADPPPAAATRQDGEGLSSGQRKRKLKKKRRKCDP